MVPKKIFKKNILLVEPEEYLFNLYSKYLVENGFVVKDCREIAKLNLVVKNENPEILILSLDITPDTYEFFYLLGGIRKVNSEVKIITMGHNAPPDVVKNCMSLGVCGHMDRRFTRPQDIVLIVKTL